jgi:hypothetical protein
LERWVMDWLARSPTVVAWKRSFAVMVPDSQVVIWLVATTRAGIDACGPVLNLLDQNWSGSLGHGQRRIADE